MAKQYELAERDYILGMSYKGIAAKYNVSVETVRSWKKRHGWERDKPVRKTAPSAPQNKKGCTPIKDVWQELEERLTDKEQLFCYHFIRTRNATQAALVSGYSQNKACAQVQGSRLMQRPRVKQEIDRLREIFRHDLQIEAMDVLQQYVNIAFADIGDLLEFNTCSVKLNDSKLLDTSIISEVKEGKEGVSVKLHDKMKALEKLELYFDLLPDNFKRRIEEEKLKLEHKKVENANLQPAGNINVVFNMPRPPRGNPDV
jgi:phage terminase small subunit